MAKGSQRVNCKREGARAGMIHETWRKGPFIHIDPECTIFHLEKPLRIGPFASIGFPGFGYYEDGEWSPKDHLYGLVILEGAALHSHVTINRGSWRDTVIGRNARLNNYAHVGHNVLMGNNVLLGVGAKIAGSVEIGDSVKVWNGAKIKQRLKIGEGAVIGMGAVVLEDVSPYTTVVGNPARRRKK